MVQLNYGLRYLVHLLDLFHFFVKRLEHCSVYLTNNLKLFRLKETLYMVEFE
jgi:hypothetical protein